MILIFDSNGGLCNQFYDITNGINFCIKYNVKFTFRNCAFRNDNLVTWTPEPFEKLFDKTLFNEYNLYINYYDIEKDVTNDNCFNFYGMQPAHWLFDSNSDILTQVTSLNKKYVVLKQFWSLYKFTNFIDSTIHTRIFPSKRIMDKYIEINNSIINDEPYNFIHYRHEVDFTSYFNCEVESLDSLIERLVFKNNGVKIYIATSSIKNLLNLNDEKYKNILYKNDDELLDFNFEERAFIDYMFGLNSVESYGDSKSSFSCMLNSIKNTNNYYDLV